MEMSLHRIIAEIKNLEAKLAQTKVVVGVASKKDQLVGNMTADQFRAHSQGIVDEFTSNLERLRKLKVARNKANVQNEVVICSQKMTLDEAIARKATASFLQNFIFSVQQQIVNATNQVSLASQETERKIEQQVSSIGGSTKKISEEEISTIRKMMERSTGKELVVGQNVDAFIKSTQTQLEQFLVEVDFVLSEANASIKVNIE